MPELLDFAANLSSLITDQFVDKCDITFVTEIDDGSGAMIVDPASEVVTDVPCFYEPYRYPKMYQLDSGHFSEMVTHTI